MSYFAPDSTSLSSWLVTAITAAGMSFSASSASAAQIAEWNFDDGTANDSVGAYDLSAVGAGASISGGVAYFDGNDGSPSFLETSGYGGSSTWSISMRIRATSPIDQGVFQGIFSNNSSATANNSWQLENYGGVYQFRTVNAASPFTVGAATGGWDTIVIRKNGTDGDVWLNGVQVVTSFGVNPGGLQNFRLGTNRNSSRLYRFEADWFQVYDSHENPELIPEPSTALLIGLGLAAMTGSRSRKTF